MLAAITRTRSYRRRMEKARSREKKKQGQVRVLVPYTSASDAPRPGKDGITPVSELRFSRPGLTYI